MYIASLTGQEKTDTVGSLSPMVMSGAQLWTLLMRTDILQGQPWVTLSFRIELAWRVDLGLRLYCSMVKHLLYMYEAPNLMHWPWEHAHTTPPPTSQRDLFHVQVVWLRNFSGKSTDTRCSSQACLHVPGTGFQEEFCYWGFLSWWLMSPCRFYECLAWTVSTQFSSTFGVWWWLFFEISWWNLSKHDFFLWLLLLWATTHHA